MEGTWSLNRFPFRLQSVQKSTVPLMQSVDVHGTIRKERSEESEYKGQTHRSQLRDGKDFECRSQQNSLYLLVFPGALLSTGLSCIGNGRGCWSRNIISRSSEIFWLVPRSWSGSGCFVQQDPYLPAFMMEMTVAEVPRSYCTQAAMCVCRQTSWTPELLQVYRWISSVLDSPRVGCRTNQCREGIFLGIL